METIQLELPDELVALLRQGNQSVEQAAKEMIVLELYRRCVISSGKAAEFLDMERFDFVRHASRLGIPFFDMTPEEWAAEMKRIEQM